MRNFGLWGSNGPSEALDRMTELVKDGAYTIMAHSVEQARDIKAKHPGADILIRHHSFGWPGMDPVQWAHEVVDRMRNNYVPLDIKRVVGANEMNLEPNPDFTEKRYRDADSSLGRSKATALTTCPSHQRYSHASSGLALNSLLR